MFRELAFAFTLLKVMRIKNSKDAKYHGESSRCAYVRGKEYMKEFASFDRSNCMVAHNMVDHDSSKEFHLVMTVEKFFKRPLQ